MDDNIPDILTRMNIQAAKWKSENDNRAIFLECYSMMTSNMLDAIAAKRFLDCQWVEKLLHKFADYYFEALFCYDCGNNTPKVWQEVHEASQSHNLHVVQHLLIGVNAHINYDLVLTLYDILIPEWPNISNHTKNTRFRDHEMVNKIIAETIDKVQDEVIEVKEPFMDIVDKALWRLDEILLTKLISKWRRNVWEQTNLLLNCQNETQKEQMLARLENDVINKGKWLRLAFLKMS